MKTVKKQIRAARIFLVDAFTQKVFRGNPAMVCILDKSEDDELMQKIAFEFNLSETAFLLPKFDEINKSNEYEIRWFTPLREMPLCGHATLAASKVLFDYEKVSSDEIIFHSQSGVLKAKRDACGISMDFPLDEPEEVQPHQYDEILKAMGVSQYEHIFLGQGTRKLVIRLKSPQEVMDIQPKFEELKKLRVDGIKGVGITSIDNKEYHFITRYFNPWAGVNEDPVTGSVHTLLAAYWSRIMGIKELKAYQASERGGELLLRIKENNRLEIVGEAKVIFRGEFAL